MQVPPRPPLVITQLKVQSKINKQKFPSKVQLRAHYFWTVLAIQLCRFRNNRIHIISSQKNTIPLILINLKTFPKEDSSCYSKSTVLSFSYQEHNEWNTILFIPKKEKVSTEHEYPLFRVFLFRNSWKRKRPIERTYSTNFRHISKPLPSIFESSGWLPEATDSTVHITTVWDKLSRFQTIKRHKFLHSNCIINSLS